MKSTDLIHRRLSPTTETQGNATNAPAPASGGDSPKRGKALLAPAPNPALSFSAADLTALIESDPAAFDTGVMPGDDDDTADAKAEADAKPKAVAGDDGKPAKDIPSAALNADQKAWLELRAAAKTPEEAAEIDKQAPAFTDEEWALAEAGFQVSNGQPAGGTKPDDAAAQLAAARTETAAARAELESATQRLKDANEELARAKERPVAVAPMHPLFAASPEEIVKAEANAVALKEWALKNWDGAEANGEQPAYTAEQVRGAYARADKQLSAIIPAARETHALFEAQNNLARQTYPALFDPKSPHSQTRESILRQLPGLKAGLPQISTVMGDAILGETLRRAMLSETPGADAEALRSALLKALPGLKELIPALAGGVRPAGRLPAKPIVPLARPSATGGGQPPRSGGGKGARSGAPDLKKFLELKAANGGNEMEALTETLRNVNVE